MFARVASVFPAGIARPARLVSRCQIAGIAHIFAPGLNAMPAKCFFAWKPCQTHFTCFTRGHRTFQAERARWLFRYGQAHFLHALLPHDPFLPLLLRNACITIMGNRSRWLSLHNVGLYAHRARVRIEEWHFSCHLLGN